MRFVFFVIALALVLVTVAFSILNSEMVHINYYFGIMALPLSVTLVLTLAIGGLVGILASLFLIIRVKFENRSLKKKVKLAEEEIINLRSLPLKDNN